MIDTAGRIDLDRSWTPDELRRAAPFTAKFNFFGARAAFQVQMAEDVDQLRFFYGYCETAAPGVDLTITMLAERGDGFVTGLLDTAIAKAVLIEDASGLRRWQRRGSPVPPFTEPPLSGSLLLIHASAVVNRSGSALLLPAVHYQGKTSLMMSMVQRGYGFLTDDIAVLDEDRNLRPFPKPIGLRENTLGLIPGLEHRLERVSFKRYRSMVTGPIWVCRVQDLYPGSLASTGIVRVVAFIRDVEGMSPRIETLRRGDALVELSKHFVYSGMPPELAYERAAAVLREARPIRVFYGLRSHLADACSILQELLDA